MPSAQPEGEGPSSVEVACARSYTAILDAAVDEWQSKELLDASVEKLSRRSSSGGFAIQAIVKELVREMNNKTAEKLGCTGAYDDKIAVMTSMHQRYRQLDPALDSTFQHLQLVIAKFGVRLKEEVTRIRDMEWAAAYPSIPLSEYKADPNFWHINEQFPGLQAVHRDPWVFVCKNVFSKKACEALIAKAKPCLVPSWVYRGDRTSWEVRIEHEEVSGLQARLSDLLDMPISHFESLKVSRYAKGDYFARHLDALPNAGSAGFPTCGSDAPFCNRVVTCFVYLTDCRRGGSTKFDCGIKIRPCQGMAVIHFPAYLHTATEQHRRGQRDERTVHESVAAVDEKFICQQWGWTAPLDAAAERQCNGARSCSETVL